MSASTGPIVQRNVPAALILRRPETEATPLRQRQPAPRRTRIWEFNTNLHCSIIGTCLSTIELRKILTRLGATMPDATDHDLHGVAVTLAGRHDDAARQLHKALDQRHRLAVNQFGRADTQDMLRSLWRDALKGGDIPGAYWATLTHPEANQAIIREAFGDVHMLSHLIGSANRADIRRLCVLEADKAALEEKLQHQQQALHDAVMQRDAQIAALRQSLASHLAANTATPAPADNALLADLVAERERRLAAESRRRVAVEERLASIQAERDSERARRLAMEREVYALRQELATLEANLTPASADMPFFDTPPLDGVTVLYVGGRPNQVSHIRLMIEQQGGGLLHHDGGPENHPTLLAGLVSRADLVVFPVDCVSHDAAMLVKSLCRRAEKRYIPLRSASITSVLAALRNITQAALGASAEA